MDLKETVKAQWKRKNLSLQLYTNPLSLPFIQTTQTSPHTFKAWAKNHDHISSDLNSKWITNSWYAIEFFSFFICNKLEVEFIPKKKCLGRGRGNPLPEDLITRKSSNYEGLWWRDDLHTDTKRIKPNFPVLNQIFYKLSPTNISTKELALQSTIRYLLSLFRDHPLFASRSHISTWFGKQNTIPNSLKRNEHPFLTKV